MRHGAAKILATLLAGSVSLPAHASVKSADSFRIGSDGVLCTAENAPADDALRSMFDRKLNIVCRDAAAPVGRIYVLKSTAVEAIARLATVREAAVECGETETADAGFRHPAQRLRCSARDTGLKYNAYVAGSGTRHYAVEGLAGYDSALRLALQTMVLDREVQGTVEAASTEAGDPAAFARLQAGILDPDRALREGYTRNNIGSFAEAAEFFDTLVQRARIGDPGFQRSAEYLANEGLQQSNMGKFAEADARFREAGTALDPEDGYVARLLRNFRAMHALNQRQPERALEILAIRIDTESRAGIETGRLAEGFLDRPITQRLNNDDVSTAFFGGLDVRLSPTEKIALLEAQALQLRGVSLRQAGRAEEAATAQNEALKAFGAIRNGELGSATWLRGGVMLELSAIAEAAGNAGEAQRQIREALQLYEVNYPGSPAVAAVRARLADLLLRLGRKDEARTEYRAVVEASQTGADIGIRTLLSGYFRMLAEIGNAEAAAEFFAASQLLIRPGVAQTQAVFARELSGGSDEAARLFRQSVTLSRDIVRADGEIARLAGVAEPRPEEQQALSAARARRAELGQQQTRVVASLADFPQYRAASNSRLDLAALQQALREAEGYYKFVVAGQDAYGLFVTPQGSRVFRLPDTVARIEENVAKVRDTIAKLESGQLNTYPFDLETSHALFRAMFGTITEPLAEVRHLVFEPDGPLLQLPLNLLVTEAAGIEAYRKRTQAADADQFDFTGIGWLGRDRIVSTAVSAKGFIDVRKIAPSRGQRPYLGLGRNAVPKSLPARQDECDWPLSTWTNPISQRELEVAAGLLGASPGSVITTDAFSDTGLKAIPALSDYRVLHFATHGLVTAPRPECPARPALLTSFGAEGSDGLLSFREIFDLRLDADTVILSACDTAGMATIEATRDAGIATGGNFALDGLVRAFVGAGARAVIASHWPVPDDFKATETLISGMFGEAEIGVGEAMRRVQNRMMDNPLTSHPYYWSGFAIIGDATRPVTSR